MTNRETNLKAQAWLLPHAVNLPWWPSEPAAGLDLVAALPANAPVIIEPGQRAAIPTGIVIDLPLGTEGEVRSRPGLALRHGVIAVAGAIPADYRGEVMAILVNLGADPFPVERGALIAQLVVAPVLTLKWERTPLVSEEISAA